MTRDYAKSAPSSPPRRGRLVVLLIFGSLIIYALYAYFSTQKVHAVRKSNNTPPSIEITSAPPIPTAEEPDTPHFDFYKLLADNATTEPAHIIVHKKPITSPAITPVALSLYVLQLEAHSAEEAAEYHQAMAHAGLDSIVLQNTNGNVEQYQVIVGPFASEMGANATKDKLEKRHNSMRAYVVPYR